MDNPVIASTRTPCIGVCSTALGGDVCRGCKRFAHEVIDWNGYTEEQKRLIEHRLSGFLTKVIQNHIEIFDEKVMARQIARYHVKVPTHRNLYCQAFFLLKAGAEHIQYCQAFGVIARPSSRSLSLKQMCHAIDEEFYALSVAEFERCFVRIA